MKTGRTKMILDFKSATLNPLYSFTQVVQQIQSHLVELHSRSFDLLWLPHRKFVKNGHFDLLKFGNRICNSLLIIAAFISTQLSQTQLEVKCHTIFNNGHGVYEKNDQSQFF